MGLTTLLQLFGWEAWQARTRDRDAVSGRFYIITAGAAILRDFFALHAGGELKARVALRHITALMLSK